MFHKKMLLLCLAIISCLESSWGIGLPYPLHKDVLFHENSYYPPYPGPHHESFPPFEKDSFSHGYPPYDKNPFSHGYPPFSSPHSGYGPEFDPHHGSFPHGGDPHQPPEVAAFLDEFTKLVFSCKPLLDLFDFKGQITAEEFQTGLKYIANHVMASKEDKEAAYHAYIATRYITSVPRKLTPHWMVKVYANSVSKYMLCEGRIDMHNIPFLAQEYARLYKEKAMFVDNAFPSSKVVALAQGHGEFLDSIGLFTIEKTIQVVTYFGNEWKAKKEFGPHHGFDKSEGCKGFGECKKSMECKGLLKKREMKKFHCENPDAFTEYDDEDHCAPHHEFFEK